MGRIKHLRTLLQLYMVGHYNSFLVPSSTYQAYWTDSFVWRIIHGYILILTQTIKNKTRNVSLIVCVKINMYPYLSGYHCWIGRGSMQWKVSLMNCEKFDQQWKSSSRPLILSPALNQLGHMLPFILLLHWSYYKKLLPNKWCVWGKS